MTTTYYCYFNHPNGAVSCVTSTRNLADFTQGFWINKDGDFTQGSDCLYWIPPHLIRFIQKHVQHHITYVVAPTYRQASDWVKSQGLTMWSYLSTPQQLHGLENPKIVWLPGWEELPDAETLKTTAESRMR